MAQLTIFNFLSLNGFYKGLGDDTSWHRHGGEETTYSEEMLRKENVLLFGRVTYELMAGYWTTTMAMESMPLVADGMNNAEKIVFSRTLKNADWKNTRVAAGPLVDEIKRLKGESAKDLAVLGSGSIVTQLADAGLVDRYEIMIDPVALPGGTTIFSGMKTALELKLVETRIFKSGIVLLCYEPLTR